MNKNQRDSNRRTAADLFYNKLPVCPECGEKGKHYIEAKTNIFGSLLMSGFWVCDKFYDPITMNRID